MATRLAAELKQLAPPFSNIRVLEAHDANDRKNAAFLGAIVFASVMIDAS